MVNWDSLRKTIEGYKDTAQRGGDILKPAVESVRLFRDRKDRKEEREDTQGFELSKMTRQYELDWKLADKNAQDALEFLRRQQKNAVAMQDDEQQAIIDQLILKYENEVAMQKSDIAADKDKYTYLDTQEGQRQTAQIAASLRELQKTLNAQRENLQTEIKAAQVEGDADRLHALQMQLRDIKARQDEIDKEQTFKKPYLEAEKDIAGRGMTLEEERFAWEKLPTWMKERFNSRDEYMDFLIKLESAGNENLIEDQSLFLLYDQIMNPILDTADFMQGELGFQTMIPITQFTDEMKQSVLEQFASRIVDFPPSMQGQLMAIAEAQFKISQEGSEVIEPDINRDDYGGVTRVTEHPDYNPNILQSLSQAVDGYIKRLKQIDEGKAVVGVRQEELPEYKAALTALLDMSIPKSERDEILGYVAEMGKLGLTDQLQAIKKRLIELGAITPPNPDQSLELDEMKLRGGGI